MDRARGLRSGHGIGTIMRRDLRDLLVSEKYRGFTIRRVSLKTMRSAPFNLGLSVIKTWTYEKIPTT